MTNKRLGIMGLLFGCFIFAILVPGAKAATPDTLSQKDKTALSQALSQLSLVLGQLDARLKVNEVNYDAVSLDRVAINSTLSEMKGTLSGMDGTLASLGQPSGRIAARNTGETAFAPQTTDKVDAAASDVQPVETAQASDSLGKFNWSRTLIAILILLVAGGIFALSLREPKGRLAANPPQASVGSVQK